MTQPRVLDVRPNLARGEEPLSAILEIANATASGESFVLLVPFEPLPLLSLLGRRGFTSALENRGADGYRVVFTRSGEERPA